MSRRYIGSFERERMRTLAALPPRAPKPPAIIAPISGRVPAIGDEVEVVVYEVNRYTRPWSTAPAWVRDRVSEVHYQQDVVAPGFTTAARAQRPALSEEGVRWRWPRAPEST